MHFFQKFASTLHIFKIIKNKISSKGVIFLLAAYENIMLKQHNEFDCLNIGECESPAKMNLRLLNKKNSVMLLRTKDQHFTNLTKNNRFIRLNSVNLMNAQTWFFFGKYS